MRLTPTSFTHGSTAVFGLAIAGYTVLRLASYAVADLPVHLGTPAPQAKGQVHDVRVLRHDVVEAGRSAHRALPQSHRHTATTVHTATAVRTTHHATAASTDDSSPAQPAASATTAAASDDTTSAGSAPAAQPVVASAPTQPVDDHGSDDGAPEDH